MIRSVSVFISVAACAALAGCGPDYTQSPVDAGGVSFDFAKLSAEHFKEDASATNLLDVTKLTPDTPYIQGNRDIPKDGEVRKAVAKSGSVRTYKDGVWSIVTDAENIDRLCAGNRSAADVVVSSWSANVPVGANPDGCRVRVSFKYRTHRAPGRNGCTWCIPFDTLKRGSAASTRVVETDNFWHSFIRDYEVAPGIEKFRLALRLDGPGDFEFKDISVRRVKVDKTKPPVEIFTSPHGWLGRDFAVSSNQCALIHYTWRRPEPLKGSVAKDYVFTFELDSGFELVELMFGDAKSVQTTHRADGGTVATVVSTVVPDKDFNTWFRHGVMIASSSPVGTRGKARLSCTYKGEPCSNVDELELFVIPEIRARMPRRYMNGFGHASRSGFVANGEDGRRRLASLIVDCGVGLVHASHETLPYLRAAGVKKVLTGFKASNGFQIGEGKLLPPDERYVALDPTRHWGIDEAACPVSVYLEKPFFKTNTVPSFKRSLEGFDGGISNWEPYYFARQGCMCDSCCREFAKWAKLDYDDVKKDWPDCIDREKGRFGNRIVDFRSWQHGQLMRTLNKYVTAFSGGEKSMGFIPEVEAGMMTSNWREIHLFEEVEIKDFGKDFKWINPWGPYSGIWDTAMPYVHAPASWTLDFYYARNIRAQASADYPGLKIMSFPMGFLPGGWVVEPEILEMNLNAFFFNGWEASAIYFFPCGYDNRYWAAVARASTTAAEYEDYVWDGTRIDERAVLTPSDNFPKPFATSNLHIPEYKNVSLLQHVAYELNGTRIVAAFNYRADGSADFTLRFTDRPGVWKLSVPAARCVVFTFPSKR